MIPRKFDIYRELMRIENPQNGANRYFSLSATSAALIACASPIYVESSDGSWLEFVATASGGETTIAIITQKGGNRGKWDLYVDGDLDSEGYNDYGGSVNVRRQITLQKPLSEGIHTFKMVTNGKDGDSTGYYVAFLQGRIMQ